MIQLPSSCRQALAGIVASILVALAGLGTVHAATPDPVMGPAWPLDTTLGYRWASGTLPPSAMRTAITAGAADATASRRSRAPGYAYASTASNAVSYGTNNPCGVNGLACMRRDVATGFGIWFRENGHRYDWGTLQWCELTGSPNGCFEVETVMLDELGHVDGLDHHVNAAGDSDYADAVVQTVSHARPQVGWNASAFARCDVATLQQLYDVASWSAPYSTCLDVPTVMTLTASPASVVSPASATFTATLKSDGTGRLDGNPMSARVVVLQQRSGTGWADLVTMSAGTTAGSYVARIAPKGTQSYRALFRKPSGEGVRTSVSGTVTVTVACTTAPCPLRAGGSGQ